MHLDPRDVADREAVAEGAQPVEGAPGAVLGLQDAAVRGQEADLDARAAAVGPPQPRRTRDRDAAAREHADRVVDLDGLPEGGSQALQR